MGTALSVFDDYGVPAIIFVPVGKSTAPGSVFPFGFITYNLYYNLQLLYGIYDDDNRRHLSDPPPVFYGESDMENAF